MFMLFIILIIILFIILFSIGILREQGLINTFKENDIFDDEIITQKSSDTIDCFELTLVNLDFLPSYRGQYQSLLFDNKLQIECYSEFNILTLNTTMSSYRIKIPKNACSIKKDIFSGKLLKISIKQHNLLFKLPNEMQNIIYKDAK